MKHLEGNPTMSIREDIAVEAARKALQDYDTKAAVNATPVNLPDDLPRNRDGQPEYATVLLTFDHLQDVGDGHVRNKMTYSTEIMPVAIANLMSYYGHQLETPAIAARVLEIVGEAAKTEYAGGILALFSDRNPHDREDRGPVIEVLMSTPSYYDLIEHEDFGKGSSLLAADQVIRAVFAALNRNKSPEGAYPVLTYLKMLEAEYAEAVDYAAPHPCEALSDIVDSIDGTGAATSPRSRCFDEGASNEFTGGQDFGTLGENKLSA